MCFHCPRTQEITFQTIEFKCPRAFGTSPFALPRTTAELQLLLLHYTQILSLILSNEIRIVGKLQISNLRLSSLCLMFPTTEGHSHDFPVVRIGPFRKKTGRLVVTNRYTRNIAYVHAVFEELGNSIARGVNFVCAKTKMAM